MQIKQLYYSLYPQKPLYVESFWQWFRLSRWVVYLSMRYRMLCFLVLEGVQKHSDARSDKVRDWNMTKDFFASPFARRRSEHLIYLLRAIPSVSRDSKILCIGPRNEGELLLLKAHGFKDVYGIDLYTYSPMIQLMDMHAMTFKADLFDVIISSYTARYSYDFIQCSTEMIRVLKPGGIVAVSFSIGETDRKNVEPVIGTTLYGGTKELQAYFIPYVQHIYWQMDDDDVDESELPRRSHTTIFKIRK